MKPQWSQCSGRPRKEQKLGEHKLKIPGSEAVLQMTYQRTSWSFSWGLHCSWRSLIRWRTSWSNRWTANPQPPWWKILSCKLNCSGRRQKARSKPPISVQTNLSKVLIWSYMYLLHDYCQWSNPCLKWWRNMRGQPVPFCPSALEKVLDDPTLQLKLQSCPERFAGLRSDTKKHRQNKSIQIYQKHTRARVFNTTAMWTMPTWSWQFLDVSHQRGLETLNLSIDSETRPFNPTLLYHLSSSIIYPCSLLFAIVCKRSGCRWPSCLHQPHSRDAALIAGPQMSPSIQSWKRLMVQVAAE